MSHRTGDLGSHPDTAWPKQKHLERRSGLMGPAAIVDELERNPVHAFGSQGGRRAIVPE